MDELDCCDRLLVALIGILPASRADTVIHVNLDGSTCLPWGETWVNACELQSAFTSTNGWDEIWAAAGTYTPVISIGSKYACFWQLTFPITP